MSATPPLSSGGMRPFTFVDIIHGLQQDLENQTTNSLDANFTLIGAVTENGSGAEESITGATASSAQAYDVAAWGCFCWQ
jgi:hypothetical protein